MNIQPTISTTRVLGKTQNAQETAMTRLASGLRVNSAKDDAAGLAIADHINTLVRGQTVAIRNANDSLSYSQTADNALGSITSILQRMRDLAVTSANATYKDTDRKALNEEFRQLQSEITHTINNTTFNDGKVFDGNPKVFQIGAGTSSDNQISLQTSDLTSIDSRVGIASYPSNGVTQDMVNAAMSDSNTTGPQMNALWGQFSQNVPVADLAAYQNARTAFVFLGGSFYPGNVNQPVLPKNGTAIINGVPTAVPTQNDLTIYNNMMTAQAKYLSSSRGIEVLDQPSALSAIMAIDNAIEEVDKERSIHGAFQNRITTAIANLQTSVENQSAAHSRIMDADFAAETANMTRSQILQQAGVAMAAQANQAPSQILTLLHQL